MQFKNKIENTFKTDDIFLTSFLLTRDIQLIEVSGNSSKRFTFVLTDPVKCESFRRQFLNNAVAPAQELFSKREMLINEIKNRKFSDSSNLSQRA